MEGSELKLRRIKKFLINILNAFIPSKRLRKRIRLLAYNPKLFLDGAGRAPLKKYEHRVKVSFCFDKNFAKQAAVAMYSLLDVSKGRCDYDIYCVVGESVSDDDKKMLRAIVLKSDSSITFLNANHDFDKSYLGDWPIGIYYRLMLPTLLPDVGRIIYADVDVVFLGDLIEADRIELGDNLVAGVGSNNYINSGFLIMNLSKMRTEKTYDKLVKESKKEYAHPDQTTLNEVCKRRILFLPAKYNFGEAAGRDFDKMSGREIIDLKYNPVMLHYLGNPKPWAVEKPRGLKKIWQFYANQTGLF
ncbi:MAG: glycosyltransferase family 8 protein [Rickettsiales bacterium]|jgi:lipopolysaccharide biosynthesis glycosyltransferase|nr:glycosyltransferase family 8 protein [Rickettsiales bacterium]